MEGGGCGLKQVSKSSNPQKAADFFHQMGWWARDSTNFTNKQTNKKQTNNSDLIKLYIFLKEKLEHKNRSKTWGIFALLGKFSFGSMIYFFYCTTTGESSQQLIQPSTNFWRFSYSTRFPFSLAWTSCSKIIIAAFSNGFLCTDRKSNWHKNQWAGCFIFLMSAEILYTALQKRVVRGPKPENFPPKYILITSTC